MSVTATPPPDPTDRDDLGLLPRRPGETMIEHVLRSKNLRRVIRDTQLERARQLGYDVWPGEPIGHAIMRAHGLVPTTAPAEVQP